MNGDDYVDFETEQVNLSIYSLKSHEKMAPGSVEPGSQGSVLLEFMVEDVDREYGRLQEMGIRVCQTTNYSALGESLDLFSRPGR